MSAQQTLQQYLQLAHPYIDDYGYLALVAIIFVESFGVPAPGQTLLIAAGLLAGQGRMDIAMVVMLAWTAAVLGDSLGYWIGRKGGRVLIIRYGRYIGIRDRQLNKVNQFFHRFGGWVVAIARFIEVLRQLNGVFAGTVEMPWWRFLLFNSIGAAMWVAVWGIGAYLFGQRLDEIVVFFDEADTAVIMIVGIGAVILLGYLGWRVWRYTRQRMTDGQNRS